MTTDPDQGGMHSFARLIESLVFMPSRNGKLRLLEAYFRATPDPDRGWALAALTEGLSFPTAKAGAIRGLATERTDPVLFALSYDYVGDLAETVALIWPERPGANRAPDLHEVVEGLAGAKRDAVPALIARWLDGLDAPGRLGLLKLITGGLRVGVSARLAKTALARLKPVDVAEIEELWHGLAAPYTDLFAWVDGLGPRPTVDEAATFRPLMLANPLEDPDLAAIEIDRYRAEWKWDGIRVQIAARQADDGPGDRRLFSRTGDEIGRAFPDIVEAMTFDAVLDGELLVTIDGAVQPFNALQQRLNRKSVTAKLLREAPAWVRLYDILFADGEDLRGLPFDERRGRLEAWFDANRPARMDISPLVPFDGLRDLHRLRDGARDAAIEGLMLKRADSPYLPGRPKGPWFKWKRDPLTADVVLVYAQRGHGKRSSYYSDFTFAAWRPAETPDRAEELVPVGKAYFGFTDEELRQLDKFVRANTVERYGPVRAVEPTLVLEVAFDSIHPSPRHKSGVAMRFPRVSRIRWDKPAEEADRLDTLKALITA